jgi:hypothetical protein
MIIAQYNFLISLIVFIIGLLVSIFGRKNKFVLIPGIIITIISGMILGFFIFLMIYGPF